MTRAVLRRRLKQADDLDGGSSGVRERLGTAVFFVDWRWAGVVGRESGGVLPAVMSVDAFA